MAVMSKPRLWCALRELGIWRRSTGEQSPLLDHPVVGWMSGSVGKDGLLGVQGVDRWNGACAVAEPCPHTGASAGARSGRGEARESRSVLLAVRLAR